MRRIVVLGSVGAGKTELATRISRHTGIPVVHLDPLFWRHGWTPAPRHEALRDLATAVAGERWILDGNFLAGRNGDEDPRFARADTVIFLDLSRATCFWRVVKRVLRDRGRSRPDLPEGCREGVDMAVLRWIWRYPVEDRPRVLAILGGLGDGVAVHHLRSPAEVARFFDTVETAAAPGARS